ncbi:MAG: radical SAM protein [bacterium]|nr:radical SAM protein [bacterium]
MKIKFVNATLGGDYSALDIAITCLATWLNERTDHRATITDLTFRRRRWREKILADIGRDRPDIIGISCNTMYMQYVRAVIEHVGRHCGLPVILGGYHASLKPEETLSIPGVEALFIGDGECTLTEYLDRRERGGDLAGIPGVWTKRDGAVVTTGKGRFIEDINALPIPDWNLWEDLDLYFYFLGMLYIIGTRGCPYKCTYCDAHGISEAVEGRYYRIREPVAYAREIAFQWEKYRHRNMRLAQLFDQIPTASIKWLRPFCEAYMETGAWGELKYSMFARIDQLDEEKLELLGKSGCALLRVGIEAGNDFIRNEVYGKHISKEKIKEIFRIARANGIGFTAFNILGGPAETPATLRETIRLAMELDANRTAFFIYKPFTEEGCRQIHQYGGWIDEDRWKAADNITFGAVVESKALSVRKVELYQKAAYFLTFGRRLLRMILRQRLRYFIRLALYLSRGVRYGLDFGYTMIYYHIYGYDNVDK